MGAPRKSRRRGRRGRGRRKEEARKEAAAAKAAPGPARKSLQKPQNRKPSGRPAAAAAADKLYAALDLGTNNCRLLIARQSPDGFKVVDAYSRIVRLGEGLASTGALGEAAMTRAIDALRICAEKMERRGVVRSRTIATAACRTADNGADFIERVRKETGLSLEIVSTEDEARLAVAGCSPLLDRACSSALVFDIGGGSTELIWVRMDGGSDARPVIADWTSLPCGVVTLAERHGGVDVPDDIYARMVSEVSGQLGAFTERAKNGAGVSASNFHLLGTSGTVTTIAGVHLGLNRYDRTRVDGLWISPDDVHGVTRALLAMDYGSRAAHPCVGQERADLVLAGCAIFEAIALAWPADRLRVADRGLREGILLSLMEADASRRRRRRKRRRKLKPDTGGNGTM
ncbi:MAG: Ppx/GppA phosphatase family protein [Parvibaculum sp.]|uniref:Ppx/GppA phosphatase family protein n=1 Tax=Parvibaculum sp. TaxID=2024848 RepID=UPI002AB97017|nr:Ppx/GppA phosphatase family protein [Parvibaculum sp.]MDZ4381633.1 Ppx/GppA phosphatase family protein [Parvibaculum sp.]